MTTEMLRDYERELQGTNTGIGAEILDRGGRFFVREVFEGGGAVRAGLKAGDEIVAVEGQWVAGLRLAELARHLRGKAGTSVRVSVRTAGEDESREVDLVRTTIHVPMVRSATIVDRDKGIGYLHLVAFNSGSEKELRRAVRGLARGGARALILDLRDNPGGSLFEAVGVAGAFLPGGRVLQTRGRMLGATWTYDVPLLERSLWRGPLAVLVNGHTASAAEVVAAALAQRGRATIIGQPTFGKGAVQINVPVGGGSSAVCVTIARVYDPTGQTLESRGVVPTRNVAELPKPPQEVCGDPVVRAAIEVLSASAPRP